MIIFTAFFIEDLIFNILYDLHMFCMEFITQNTETNSTFKTSLFVNRKIILNLKYDDV